MAEIERDLPDFETRPGYPHWILPDGVYSCDEAAFEARFVRDFSQSATRQAICEGFFRLRSDSVAHGFSAVQWVDGSFVENKENPNDVDVVTFIDVERLNNASPEARQFVLAVLNGKDSAETKYRTHAFFIASCLQIHAYYPVFDKFRAYWRKWLGETYDKSHPDGDNQTRHRKGFVALPLGEAEMVPHVSTERSN